MQKFWMINGLSIILVIATPAITQGKSFVKSFEGLEIPNGPYMDRNNNFTPRFYLELGNSAMKRGDYQAAERLYREAIRREADYSDAHNNLGTALAEQGKYEEAQRHTEKP